MKKVYIAGAMSDPDCIEFLMNLNRGIRASKDLLLMGYAPYSPFIDFQFFLALIGDEYITGEMIKNYSLAWLEVSDAILVLPNHHTSKGTQAEITRAKELGIPIYYSLEELKRAETINECKEIINKIEGGIK